MELTRREEGERRLTSMKAERKPYEQDWEEIARLALPARSAFLTNNKQTRKANITSRDAHGSRASRILANGMQSGLSPSSMPWFKLQTTDRDMMEFQPVKEWLAYVERSIYDLFQGTNFYDASKVGYSEIGCFGVDACVMVEHPEYKAVCHSMTAGEFWISTDAGLRTDTLYRQANMTVDQVMRSKLFDQSKVSKTVKNLYAQKNYNTIVPIIHAIEPNTGRDPTKLDSRNMPFRSFYWECGNSDKNALLYEGGYDGKPFWAPRWETTSNEVYSQASPGFVALPDLREMQLAARRRGRNMDMLVKPPMKASVGMAGSLLNLDPGSITYASLGDLEGLGPMITTQYQAVQAIREDLAEKRQDVDMCFFVDLFMAISEREGVQPLNDLETSLRNDEKFTQLGPVVDRVNIEKLEVAIDRAYSILDNANQLPPPPPELQGQPLTINFVSMLAQAQRAAANTAIERAARFVGFIAGIFPDAAIKFDAEQAIDEFATGTGTPPKIIRSDEMVAQMKEAMDAQKQQEQMAMMAQPARDGAQAAELLSRTDVGGGRTALQALAGQPA